MYIIKHLLRMSPSTSLALGERVSPRSAPNFNPEKSWTRVPEKAE